MPVFSKYVGLAASPEVIVQELSGAGSDKGADKADDDEVPGSVYPLHTQAQG